MRSEWICSLATLSSLLLCSDPFDTEMTRVGTAEQEPGILPLSAVHLLCDSLMDVPLSILQNLKFQSFL